MLLTVPGPKGRNGPGETSTLLDRCLADDMAVGLEEPEMYPYLREQLDTFSEISDHNINYPKSYAILCGRHRERERHLGQGHAQDPRLIDEKINWTTIQTFRDKYHGIYIADPKRVAQQYRDLKDSAERQAAAVRGGQQRSHITHRIAYLKMHVISKLLDPMTYQCPDLDTADKTIEMIQKALNGSAFGGAATIAGSTLVQRTQDLGMGHTDLAALMDAASSRRIADMLTDLTHRPWQNFYRYQLHKHYGHTAPPDVIAASNYSFQAIVNAPEGTITGTCRRAFRAWGSLPTIRTAEKPADQNPHPNTTPEMARATLLFHHTRPVERPWYLGCARSTAATEETAARFARHRVRTIGDVLDTRNKRLITIKQFADLHPELARQDYARVIAGIPRTIIHHACKQMPRDGPGQWVSTPDGKIGRIESDGAGGSRIRIHRCHKDRLTLKPTEEITPVALYTRATVAHAPLGTGGANKEKPPGGTLALREEQRARLPPTLVATQAEGVPPLTQLQIAPADAAPSAAPTPLVGITQKTLYTIRVQQKYGSGPRAWDPEPYFC